MKKLVSLVLVLVILFITACGNGGEYYLTYNGKNIKLDTAYNVETHGQYNNLFESANCAFGDRDVTYIYDDIEVETYGNGKNELIIYSIRFTTDKVKTNEKIGINDNIEDAIKAYGNDYTKTDNKYTYKHGKTSLIFITSNDIIESIEYELNNIN